MTMLPDLDALEARRVALQQKLDGQKTPEDRNRLGQFATPPALAREIVAFGVQLLPRNELIRFLDPAIGSGAFFSALCSIVSQERIESCTGYEIDPFYGRPSRKLWKKTSLKIHLGDFTQIQPSGQTANLVVCNPPYVRHHHIDASQKTDLQKSAMSAIGMKINGLAGLYCYFMGLSHVWMAKDGIAGWLVPSEFMGVNYGLTIKRYLLERVTLLRVHRYDPQDVQFNDALVSSAVVWLKNSLPSADHKVAFTYGGSLGKPAKSRHIGIADISCESKWTLFSSGRQSKPGGIITLGDMFEIKRGLVTGDNNFFIMNRDRIETLGLPFECFSPILPGPRFLPDTEILSGEGGLPQIDRQLFLLNTRIKEDTLQARYPALWKYLEEGQSGDKPVASRYLCRCRTPWYSQEHRPPAPIMCTYMGRGLNGRKPFRFILNWSKATASNVYLLLYPKPVLANAIAKRSELTRAAWQLLNEVDTEELLHYGRVYGGGLYKLEPKELRRFPADRIAKNLGVSIPMPDLASPTGSGG